MNWLLNHCKDYTEFTGMSYLAKKVAFWSMTLEDPVMLEKAFEYYPYFTDEDKEIMKKAKADFLAFSYYSSWVLSSDKIPEIGRAHV